jgi:hypothetical protein
MARLRFALYASVLVRGQAKREIQAFCWRNGLECDVQESKSLLESLYRVTITGPDRQIRRAADVLNAWLADPYEH